LFVCLFVCLSASLGNVDVVSNKAALRAGLEKVTERKPFVIVVIVVVIAILRQLDLEEEEMRLTRTTLVC
jgi:hypothetical protein